MNARIPVIEMHDVTFAYERDPVVVRASLSIPEGDFACIIGPNAGGKSTLLKLMLGLLAPQRGQVRVLGKSPEYARGQIGYLSQYMQFDRHFPVTVMDVVLMGRLSEKFGFGPYRRADKAVAEQALREVGLQDLMQRRFETLSGGQRQRVLIARALACQPAILMLDEPTSNLDINVEEQLYALLQQLNERLTVVMVSHDVAFVSKYVKTAICVNRTVHVHTAREISGEIIQTLYGREIRLLRHDEHEEHAENADASASKEPRNG